MTKTSINLCKAKNPDTCPYHSVKAYTLAYQNLENAVLEKQTAHTLFEVEQAFTKIKVAVAEVDSTHKGYQKLMETYVSARDNDDIATVAQLAQRVDEARNNRALKEQQFETNTTFLTKGLTAVLGNKSPTLYESIAALNSENYYDVDNGNNEFVTPSTGTELKAKLKNIRGLKDGGVRGVTVDWKNSKNIRSLDIVAPKDGRPLFVYSESGFVNLNVVSGTVIVNPLSKSGNVITVKDGATAIILTGQDASKVTVETQKGAQVIYVPADQSRTRLYGEGNVVVAPSAFKDSSS